MELHILQLLDFQMYGAEPMSFLRRLWKAADTVKDVFVQEMSSFFLDALMLISPQGMESGLKASASLFTTLLVQNAPKISAKPDVDTIWTANLKYYTGNEYSELLSWARLLVKTLKRVLDDRDLDGERALSLTTKYLSESRHHGLLKVVKHKDAQKVLEFIDSLSV